MMETEKIKGCGTPLGYLKCGYTINGRIVLCPECLIKLQISQSCKKVRVKS